MKYLIILAIFCLGFSSTLAKNDEFDIGKTLYEGMHRKSTPSPRFDAILDGLLDEVLARLRMIIRDLGLISIPLPNLGPLPIGDSIEANLTNGFIQGFQTIHRTGSCKLSIQPNGDIMVLVDGGGNQFALLYELSLNLFGIPVPLLSLTGMLDWIDLRLALRIDAEFRIRVETLELDNLGNLNLKVAGFGDVISVIIQFIAQLLGNLVKNTVANFLATTIKDAINYILSNITRASLGSDGTLSIGSQASKAVHNAPQHMSTLGHSKYFKN